MENGEGQESLAGFTAPLDPTGNAALYGAPPWHFRGRSVTVLAACDPDAVAALLPAPLEPTGDGLVRFTVHDLLCDIGLGMDYAARHPERCTVREAVVALSARHKDKHGYYDPFLYCDSDAEIAVGREMFGWPQVGAEIWLTPPDPIRGLGAGAVLAAKVSRLGRPVFDLETTLEQAGDFGPDVPAFATFYTMRVLPDPTGGPTVREVFASEMSDVQIHEPWTGSAVLRVRAPELIALKPGNATAARANAITWTKSVSRLLARSVVAP